MFIELERDDEFFKWEVKKNILSNEAEVVIFQTGIERGWFEDNSRIIELDTMHRKMLKIGWPCIIPTGCDNENRIITYCTCLSISEEKSSYENILRFLLKHCSIEPRKQIRIISGP